MVSWNMATGVRHQATGLKKITTDYTEFTEKSRIFKFVLIRVIHG